MYCLVLYDIILRTRKGKKFFLTLLLTKEATRQICAHCNHPVYGRLRLQLPVQSPSQVRWDQRKSACGPKKNYFQYHMILSLYSVTQFVPNKSFSCNARKETFFREVIPKSAYKWILLQLIIFFILISVPFCLLFCVQNQIIARKFARKRVRNGLEESLQFLAWARRRCCSLQRVSPEEGFSVNK